MAWNSAATGGFATKLKALAEGHAIAVAADMGTPIAIAGVESLSGR